MYGDLAMRTRETSYEVGDNAYNGYITPFEDWKYEQRFLRHSLCECEHGIRLVYVLSVVQLKYMGSLTRTKHY